MFLQFVKPKNVTAWYPESNKQPTIKNPVPGPGTYTAKPTNTAPNYQFGGRFDGRREPMIKRADGRRFDS